jgi:galacturan 1,4-alpha-galacturonidase
MLPRLILLAATLASALAVPSFPLISPHLCTVKASGGDDAPALSKALNGCLIVNIPKDQVLSIRSPLNTTSLRDVYVNLRGTIKYYDDVQYWVSNAFYFGIVFNPLASP